MEINRNLFLRTLKMSNNNLEKLARGANVKLGHFITKETLLEICKFLENNARTYERLVLKNRIEEFVNSQRLQND